MDEGNTVHPDSGFATDLKYEEEILNELLEDSDYEDPLSTEQRVSVAEAACDVCKGGFDSVESLKNHLKLFHSDDVVDDDSLDKSIAAEESNSKKEGIDDQVTISDLASNSVDKNTRKTSGVKKNGFMSEFLYYEVGKSSKSKVIVTAEPVYDEKKLYCITCDRQLASRTAFRRHRHYHKAQFHKQAATDSNRDSQEDVSMELPAKDELDINDLGIKDSVHDASNVENGDDDNYVDHDAVQENSYSVNLDDSDSSSDDRLSKICTKVEANTSKVTDVANETTKAASQVKMVYSENPIYDYARSFCVTCNHKFSSRKALRCHKFHHNRKILERQGIKRKEPPLTCEICLKRYTLERSLREHIVTQHGDKIPPSLQNDPTYLMCKFCHKKFEKPTERYQHEEDHLSEENPYRCSVCPKSFPRNWKRQLHELVHKGKDWKEPVQMVFSDNPSFDNEKNFCITCNYKFSTKGSFNHHKNKHKAKIREKQAFEKAEEILSCELCGRQYTSEFALRQHTVIYHEDTIPLFFKDDPTYLQCQFCDKQFEKPTERYQHEETHVEEEMPYRSTKETDDTIADIPSYSPKTIVAAKSNMVVTAKPLYDDDELFCLSCDRQFDTKKAFWRHKTYHKEKYRQQAIAHWNFGSQGDASMDTVKDDLYTEDFEIDDSVDPIADIVSHSTDKNTRKASIVKKNGFITEFLDIEFGKSRKSKVVVTAKPVYDQKRLYCITCDRQLASKTAFRRHRHYHKTRFQLTAAAHWKRRNQGDVSQEIDNDDSAHDASNVETAGDDNYEDHDPLQIQSYAESDRSSDDYLPEKNGNESKEPLKMVVAENPAYDSKNKFCITCNYQFSSRANFKYHKLQHKVKILERQVAQTAGQPLTCELCRKRYRTEFALRRHGVRYHGNAIPKFFKDDPTYLQCRFCHKQFERPLERHQHEEDHASETAPYRCPFCPKTFESNYKRKNHQILHNEKGWKPPLKMVFSENPIYDNEQNFCITCNHKFASWSTFRGHKQQHRLKIIEKQVFEKTEEILTCEFCFRRYGSSFSLRQHTVIRHKNMIPKFFKDDPTYLQCRFCHKQFDKPMKRYKHEKIHAVEKKPYRCSLCLQTFSKMNRRNIHELMHGDEDKDLTGWKPIDMTKILFPENLHYCTTCNFGFGSRASLEAHNRIHVEKVQEETGVLSKFTFNCDFCSKQFESEEGLRRHVVPHHGDKIPKSFKDDPTYLKCCFCQMEFETPTERYEHEKSRCSLCPEYFTSRAKRKLHESTHNEDGPKPKKIVRVVFTRNPKFDYKKLFCITCNREFATREALSRHEGLHKRWILEKQLSGLKAKFSCVFCSKLFVTQRLLKEHTARYHRDKIHSSSQDDRFEGSTECYEPEESQDEKRKEYKCSLCPKTFMDNFSRRLHESAHKEFGVRPPEEQATNVFPEKVEVEEQKFVCPTCDRAFTSRVSLVIHKQQHRKKKLRKKREISPERAISCEFCSRQFVSEKNFRLHTVLHHGDKIPSYFKDDPSYLQCRFCYMEFERPTERYKHEKSHAKETAPYRCSICRKLFKHCYTRKAHESRHKDGSNVRRFERVVFSENPEFDDDKFFCITCNRGFANKCSLTSHKQKHRLRIREKESILLEPTIACEFCSRHFQSINLLRDHIVPYHGEEIPTIFKDDPTYCHCRFCSEQFETPTERYEHEKSHAGEKRPYRCSLCPRCFVDEYKRKMHEMLHEENDSQRPKLVFSENPIYDDKKLLCITCNRGFISRSSLKSHKRNHRMLIFEKQSGVPLRGPFTCEFCTDQFELADALRRHAVLHHGDQIPMVFKNDPTYLKCCFCHMEFETPTERHQHEETHAGETTPYQCAFCPKSYSNNSKRRYHEFGHRDHRSRRRAQRTETSANEAVFHDHIGIAQSEGEYFELNVLT